MKVDVSRLSIAMLGHDHYSQSFSGIFAFTVYRLAADGGTIQQHHHVRVLFDGSTLTQVAQFWAMSGPACTLTVQLAQKQDGDI